MTWNPVWGCRNRCEYCYARVFAKRFYNVIADKENKWSRGRIYQGELANRLRHFVPSIIFSHLYKKLPKNPQRIFVDSMSEIAHWNEHWMDSVLERIKYYPQHIFQFLTRYPDIYFGIYKFPINCWLGTTITGPLNKGPMKYYTEKSFNINKDNLKFISFEPLLERIEPKFKVGWVIVGAETGNRKGKIIPKIEWIDEIVIYCRKNNIPIYLKDSLKDIYPEKIKMFP
jgi:protein gp37